MSTTTTEQIVREAPGIEAYKLGLLESAKGLSNQPVNLPAYQVAGFNPDQEAALAQARTGIGAYQPYLAGGQQALQQGLGTTQEAANVLRGADTRNQFGAAQGAMNLAGQATGNINQATQAFDPAYGFLGQGAGLTGLAAQQAMTARPDYQNAMGLMGQSVNQLMGGAQAYNPASAQAFMNPYQQQVIDATMAEMNRQQAITQQGLSAQAVRSGAFGGSREGIQRQELQRNVDQQKASTIANLLNQGYSQAQAASQAAFEAQQGRQQSAGQGIGQQAGLAGQLATQEAQLGQSGAGLLGNLGGQYGQFGGQLGSLAGQQANIYGQQAGLYQNLGQGIGNLAGQQFGVGQQMAQGLGSLGSQLGNLGVQQAALGQSAQQLGQGDVNFLYNIGQQQQALTQQQLDAQRNTQLQQAYEPYQRLGFLSDIYKGAPSSQQTISAATAPTPSTAQQVAGLGIAGLSAAAAGKKAGLF
jgi:hypothetical protein